MIFEFLITRNNTNVGIAEYFMGKKEATNCGFILVTIKICPILLSAMAFLERRLMEHEKVLR